MKPARIAVDRRFQINSALRRFEQQKINIAAAGLFVDFLFVGTVGQIDSMAFVRAGKLPHVPTKAGTPIWIRACAGMS
jgi:hypothetical protein